MQWITNRERRREAGIPDTASFQTKCELARVMIERISKAQIPLSWIVADTVYGNNLDLRTWLEDHGYFFVLAVERREEVAICTPDGVRRQVEACEVETLMISPEAWQRLSMGNGTKGPRLYDWAAVPILHQWVNDAKHWFLIRRCIDDPKIKTYYMVFGPPSTSLEIMVKVIGKRWRIEDDFQTNKALGLAEYQVRGWTAWYRHMTLVLLAHAFLTVMCVQSQQPIVVDADPPDPSSSAPVANASFPDPPPVLPLLISAPQSAPQSVPVAEALEPSPALTPVSPLMVPSSQSSLPPVPVAQESSLSLFMDSSPPLRLAPLTVLEVRHLLAALIWPTASNPRLVLAWSGWRRRHRKRSSDCHTKRRLDTS